MASTRSPPNRGSTPLAQDEGEFVAALLAGLDAYLASTSSLDRSFVTCLDWLISGAYRSACSAGPPTMSPPHSALVRIGIGRPAEPAPASAARTAARGSASTLPANRGRPSLLSLGRCPQCCEEMRCNVRVTSPCARRNIASGPGMLWSTAGMHSIMLPFVVTATSRRNRAFREDCIRTGIRLHTGTTCHFSLLDRLPGSLCHFTIGHSAMHGRAFVTIRQ